MAQPQNEPTDQGLTRREMLVLGLSAGALAGGIALAYRLLHKDRVPDDALDAPLDLEASVFSASERTTMVAACDAILPGDPASKFASASEAGVPAYLEAFAAKSPNLKQNIAASLQLFEQAAQVHGRGATFAALPPAERETLLTTLSQQPETREAIETFAALCLKGYLSDPKQGGNLKQRGWASLNYAPEIPEERKIREAWKAT